MQLCGKEDKGVTVSGKWSKRRERYCSDESLLREEEDAPNNARLLSLPDLSSSTPTTREKFLLRALMLSTDTVAGVTKHTVSNGTEGLGPSASRSD